MKLLVFAHAPPPHHGQSYMVQLMVEGFGGNRLRKRGSPAEPREDFGIECYHVNCRLSDKLQDIGDFRVGKFWRLLRYCLQSIWYRYRYGVENFYYIPAPGKRSAIYRDWVVMLLCRPFFKRVILHWHACGLGKWLETCVQMRYRALTYRSAGHPDLSIVLSNYGRADAEKLYPRRVAVVGNGIPDSCPNFTRELLPFRESRLAARNALLNALPLEPGLLKEAGPDPGVFRVLFVGHCTRSKGLFEAVQGAILAQRRLEEQKSKISLTLTVAGEFVDPAEEAEFKKLCASWSPSAIKHVGYVAGPAKDLLMRGADCFCFPSHIESFGLVLVEAMAYGLPIVTTRRGALPEVVPPGYPGVVEAQQPERIAEALLHAMTEHSFADLRARFESRYTVDCHLKRLACALKSVESEKPGTLGHPAEVFCG
jgi:glycosyltransferase involved in cell wall biosynthesis